MIVKFIFYLKVKIHIMISQYEMRRVVISHVTLRIVIKSFERMIFNWFKIDFNVFSGENFDFNVNMNMH